MRPLVGFQERLMKMATVKRELKMLLRAVMWMSVASLVRGAEASIFRRRVWGLGYQVWGSCGQEDKKSIIKCFHVRVSKTENGLKPYHGFLKLDPYPTI